MNALTSTVTGCGSSACGCAETPAAVPPAPDAFINGVALHTPGQRPDIDTLRERAYSELLRQQAVMKGLLPPHSGLVAPELGDAERKIIEDMVDREVLTPQPDASEGQRYRQNAAVEHGCAPECGEGRPRRGCGLWGDVISEKLLHEKCRTNSFLLCSACTNAGSGFCDGARSAVGARSHDRRDQNDESIGEKNLAIGNADGHRA